MLTCAIHASTVYATCGAKTNRTNSPALPPSLLLRQSAGEFRIGKRDARPPYFVGWVLIRPWRLRTLGFATTIFWHWVIRTRPSPPPSPVIRVSGQLCAADRRSHGEPDRAAHIGPIENGKVTTVDQFRPFGPAAAEIAPACAGLPYRKPDR